MTARLAGWSLGIGSVFQRRVLAGHAVPPGSETPLDPALRFAGDLGLLRPEAPDPIEVVGSEGEPKQKRDLHPSEHPEEAACEVGEGSLEGRVHRLDGLAAIPRD